MFSAALDGDSLIAKVFNTELAVRTSTLAEIKKRMGNMFLNKASLLCYLADDTHRQIVHICYGCLEKMLLTRNYTFVKCEVFVSLVDAVNYKKIDADMVRSIAPDNGCIFSAVQKKIPVSEICRSCQLSILRCLYKDDVNTFCFWMLLTVVSALLSFGVVLVIYIINEPANCFYSVLVGISYLCWVYLAYWTISYSFVKKKIDQVTKDLDGLFDQQNRLLERISALSSEKKMSRRFILMNSYVPYRPKTYIHNEKDLLTRFYEPQYNKILSDPDFYFENVKITNFDIIHHECRGDDLENDRQYYETLQKKKVNEEIVNDVQKYHFVWAAKRSEREDVRLENDLLLDHFKVTDLKEQLKQNDIYLSNMYRRKKTPTTVNLCLFSFLKNDNPGGLLRVETENCSLSV